MPVQITIADVPEEVRDKLAKRAALCGQTLEEFLRRELERLATPTDRAQLMREIEERLEASQTHVPGSEIVRILRADRK